VPELPEVETVRRQIEPDLNARRLLDAWSHPSEKFTPAHDATGAVVVGIRRRGKFLLVDLARDLDVEPDQELIIHLGMTGHLEVVQPSAPEPTHLRASWQLDDSRVLRFSDVRRFGRLRVVESGDHSTIPTLARLGPEPFDEAFTPESLRLAIASSSRHLKTQLLGQRPVAGLGNIYADEALWRAEVNPAVRSITLTQARRLHTTIREVLRQGIDNGGTTLRDYRSPDGREGANQHRLDCYGRSGQACGRCSTVLESRTLDQRTTTWCPSCQAR